DLGEISSGSTTTHYDISLPDYEAFYFDDDHIKEISSCSPITQSDISLFEYDSFIFNLTHEEFVDEIAHIISPPEYDCFYFWNLFDPGELMSVLNFGIRENLSTTLVNLPIKDDHSPLLAYVVWIFVAYLTYLVIPPYLHPFGNEDTIFDPGITINHFYSFKPGSSHRHEVIKSSVEDLVPIPSESEGIPEHKSLNDNPTPSSDCKIKFFSTSLNSFLEETNTFHNSLPEFENFYFDLGEISSGSTTTHSDISLPDYEAFYFDDDHIKEISSGSTTTYSDISLSEYDSFIFDLTHEEFIDELTHIISPPEYDCFYFRNLPDLGELMSVLNSEIRENLSTTLVNLSIENDHSSLLAYVVWIFVAYLTNPFVLFCCDLVVQYSRKFEDSCQ
nr:hypothetical protein [Tanacetum cinerariifolium]